MKFSERIRKISLLGADPASSKAGRIFQIIIAPFILIQLALMLLAILFQVYLFIFEGGSDSNSTSTKNCSIVTTSSGEAIDSCEYLNL